MAYAFVANSLNNQQSANGPTVTYTMGTIASGNHLVLHLMRRLTGGAITAVASTASGAVTSIDFAGAGFTGWAHGVASIYFPNGATGADEVDITWGTDTSFNFFSAVGYVYSGLETSTWKDGSAQAGGFTASPDSGLTAATTFAGMAFGAILTDTTGTTFTAGSSYTARQRESVASYGTMDGEDRATISGTQYRANGTLSGATTEDTICVTYKEAGGPPPPPADSVQQFAMRGSRW